jgi:hypothetical protein
LFRIERDASGAAPGTSHYVNDFELASRLSFFLWSSIPDDELLDLAGQGKLRQAGVLEQQVRRMLEDPRSASLVTNCAEQWLFLKDLDAKRPNELLFPDFDESLRAAFRKETDLFVDSVLRGDRSVLELLSANYTFVDERLAKHYGIPNVHGDDFRRVAFAPGSPRGGLLAQGSLLTITSYANRTSPVNRGKWVLENLLAAPPPPPPNVPALKADGADPSKTLTMREAMVQHRASPACASCHSRMWIRSVSRWKILMVWADGATACPLRGIVKALNSLPTSLRSPRNLAPADNCEPKIKLAAVPGWTPQPREFQQKYFCSYCCARRRRQARPKKAAKPLPSSTTEPGSGVPEVI